MDWISFKSDKSNKEWMKKTYTQFVSAVDHHSPFLVIRYANHLQSSTSITHFFSFSRIHSHIQFIFTLHSGLRRNEFWIELTNNSHYFLFKGNKKLFSTSWLFQNFISEQFVNFQEEKKNPLLLLLLFLLPPNETLMTANDVFLAFNPFGCMLNNAKWRLTWNDARWTMIELNIIFYSLHSI